MTSEEAIKHCMDIAETQEMCSNGKKCAEEHRQLADWLKELKALRKFCTSKTFDMAIEALEQTDVLDKIRAEIEQKCCITVGQENEPAITLYDVFQIIDKYKAEGSGEDADSD